MSEPTITTQPCDYDILVVDDQDKNLQLLGSHLHKEGYDVIFANSGAEALEIVNNDLPDLILLDVMMPEMDGYEVCKRLKADPKTAEVPVIFVTARTASEDVVMGFEVGGQDYITKPVKAAEMLVRVKTHLELRSVRQQLAVSNEELRVHNEHQKQTFSILSHDLKGPISTVSVLMSELEIALCEGEDTSSLITMVEETRQNIERLNTLIQDVLEWSRVQMDAVHFEPQDFVISEAVDIVLAQHAPQAERKGLHLENQIRPDCLVYADINMVTTVLRNLVSNAIKFTPRGGRIKVKSEKTQKGTQISVIDSGMGMSQDIINKLFKIGEVKSRQGTDHESGSGLGLALCKGLIDKCGGYICADSRQGEGSSICFTLPPKPDSELPDEAL